MKEEYRIVLINGVGKESVAYFGSSKSDARNIFDILSRYGLPYKVILEHRLVLEWCEIDIEELTK